MLYQAHWITADGKVATRYCEDCEDALVRVADRFVEYERANPESARLWAVKDRFWVTVYDDDGEYLRKNPIMLEDIRAHGRYIVIAVVDANDHEVAYEERYDRAHEGAARMSASACGGVLDSDYDVDADGVGYDLWYVECDGARDLAHQPGFVPVTM